MQSARGAAGRGPGTMSRMLRPPEKNGRTDLRTRVPTVGTCGPTAGTCVPARRNGCPDRRNLCPDRRKCPDRKNVIGWGVVLTPGCLAREQAVDAGCCTDLCKTSTDADGCKDKNPDEAGDKCPSATGIGSSCATYCGWSYTGKPVILHLNPKLQTPNPKP